MAHMALYRKWRPLSFEDVVEQSHIVNTLKNSIQKDAVSHAYLFCGTRGTGKTTLAKIFSRAVNCLNPISGNPCNACDICNGILDGSIIDVIEIDAASNNGVDDVRQIKEAVMYVPAVAKYKVYIIDEVHMLSTGAFNALLKTLEEPPKSVIFILATTEPHKLPATILSRCQRFDFKRISLSGLASRLRKIAEAAQINCDDAALNLMARLSQGGMRDAISLLDQCMASGRNPITRDEVISTAGLTASDKVDRLSAAMVDKDSNLCLTLLNEALQEGYDLLPLCAQLIEWFRNLMLYQTGGSAVNLIEWTDEELTAVKDASQKASYQETVFFVKELSELEAKLKWAENQRILMEVALVRLSSRVMPAGAVDDEKLAFLESRIAELEKRLTALPTDIHLTHAESAVKPKPASKTVQEPSMNATKPPVREDHQDSGVFKGKEVRDWPDVIEYVQKSGRMKVYAYLLDTRCIIQDEDTAVVVVSPEDGLKKMVLSRNDSIEVISEGLAKVLQKQYKIKVKDEKELGRVKAEQEEDPVLEKVKKFALDNDITLNIGE